MRGGTKTLHRVRLDRREELFARISQDLQRDADVVFAYVFGSALTEPVFHDLDVAVRLEDAVADPRDRALELAEHLGSVLGIPVDVQPLNDAPVSFAFHALQGRLLFSRDDERLANTIEDTVRRYLDAEPLVRRATREAFLP